MTSKINYNGKRTPLTFTKRIRVLTAGCVGGKKESEGPVASFIDECFSDPLIGEKSFEKAESVMCKRALTNALSKVSIDESCIDLLLAGDLMNQCTSSGYGLADFDIPYFGLYGACSTFAQGLIIGATLIESGQIDTCAVVASSHFCSAERQFRFPLAYGSFGSSTAQNTVTGAGAIVLCNENKLGLSPSEDAVYVREALPGIVSDRGIKDAANMGAAMCSAAADTLLRYSEAIGGGFESLDLIATGDLGWEGTKLLSNLLGDKSRAVADKLTDCGLLIYDLKNQEADCGGSGCGCSAVVTSGYLLDGLRCGKYNKIALVGTGAMMSPKSIKQGESIPGIAHLVSFERGGI